MSNKNVKYFCSTQMIKNTVEIMINVSKFRRIQINIFVLRTLNIEINRREIFYIVYFWVLIFNCFASYYLPIMEHSINEIIFKVGKVVDSKMMDFKFHQLRS